MDETFPSDTDPYKKYDEDENQDEVVEVDGEILKLDDILEEACPEALKADGFDGAIIGHCHDIATGCDRIIYEYESMVKILVNMSNMSQEEAVEFLEFNVLGAYMGKNTPIFMHRII